MGTANKQQELIAERGSGAITRPTSHLALDAITGVANRELFDYEGVQALSMVRRHESDLGLAMFRIDNLIDIAQRDGLPVAKKMLQRVARVLDKNTREHDTSGRITRTRFAVLLPGAREFGAHKFAVRILSAMRSSADNGDPASCVISVAVSATNSVECSQFDTLNSHVWHRLDTAIAAGGNRIVSSFCQ